MNCRCAGLCQEYGNCSWEHVDGLQNLSAPEHAPPAGVKERRRCQACGQVWELRDVSMSDGQVLPWVVKEGVTPDPEG
jgi:hypothetical protein